MKDKLRTPDQGSDTAVWLAISPSSLSHASGLFYQGMQNFLIKIIIKTIFMKY